MATFLIDFENGNDNYSGDTFDVLTSGTNGRISGASGASGTFSSAGASFPNDGSLIGRYISVFNGTNHTIFTITAYISSTSLTIASIPPFGVSNQTVDRQYYIGGRWKSVFSGARSQRIQPGDTIRIMGSPPPTSLGINGTWTSGPLENTKSISSSTNATPISVTSTAHGYSTGDTVVVATHTINTNANGTWEITVTGANTFTLDNSVGNGTGGATGTVRRRNNTRIMLASALTQNIASTGPGRQNWVASANVTTSQNTLGNLAKEHSTVDQIIVNTAFTTGKAAYYTLPSTLNLSGYQQVSFWFRGINLNSGQVELRLCSDTIGNTVVNTITIPAVSSIGSQVITVNTGAPLGSSIASISLNVNTDLSTTANQTLQLSNIIACKASSADDSLTLSSLIGKNTSGETFWGIQSINGTRVMLDAGPTARVFEATARGYYGTSETVTTWKREAVAVAANSQQIIFPPESGTSGNPITFSGGWDRTAMNTQNLESWFDGVNGVVQGIQTDKSYINYENLAFVRCGAAVTNFTVVNENNYDLIAANNCSSTATSASINFGTQSGGFSGGGSLRIDYVVANSGLGILVDSPRTMVEVTGTICSNNGNGMIVYGGDNVSIKGGANNLIANNNGAGILFESSVIKAQDIVLRDNVTSEVRAGSSTTSANIFLSSAYLYKCILDGSSETSFVSSLSPGTFYSQDHDQTPNNHKIFANGALISSATDQRKTASGISWKIQPTSTDRSASWPIALSLAKVACSANSLVTIKAWMRRSNTDLTMRLVCKGGQIAGVTSDVANAMTAAADTWAEQTITFTPTEVGVVEITAEAWGGTTFSGWVDDLTISQA